MKKKSKLKKLPSAFFSFINVLGFILSLYPSSLCFSLCVSSLSHSVTLITLITYICLQASPIAQLVKNPPAVTETWTQSLGWEDHMEKGKATHSSILAWRIP